MKLLYAIDIRDEELWHLDEVADWAARLGATVDLIYVNPFGDYAPYVLDPALGRALELGLEKARKADLARVEAALGQLPEALRGEAILDSGDAAPAIARRSAGYHAVVLSTRANKGLRRLWLGSVAERVLRQLRVPAIVLHGREDRAPGVSAGRSP